jgi:hypothetical protein
VTAFGRVALDGEEVSAPGNGEREIMEEACARVTGARLLGFVRGRCADGREKGLVLVRSIWTEAGAEPIYARAAREAGLTLPD